MSITNRELVGMKWVTRETLTAGEARAILAAAKKRGLHGMGKINSGLTKQQAWDILSAGIENVADHDPIHSIAAKNITREFG